MSQQDGEVITKHTPEDLRMRSRDMVLSISGVLAGDPPVLTDEECSIAIMKLMALAAIGSDFHKAFCDGLIEGLKIIQRTREGERISALAAGQPDTTSDNVKNTRFDILEWLNPSERETIELLIKSLQKYKDWIKNGRNTETGINLSLNFQALELLAKLHGGMVQATFEAGLKSAGVRQDLLPTWTLSNGS